MTFDFWNCVLTLIFRFFVWNKMFKIDKFLKEDSDGRNFQKTKTNSDLSVFMWFEDFQEWELYMFVREGFHLKWKHPSPKKLCKSILGWDFTWNESIQTQENYVNLFSGGISPEVKASKAESLCSFILGWDFTWSESIQGRETKNVYVHNGR